MMLDQLIARLMRARSEGASGRSNVLVTVLVPVEGDFTTLDLELTGAITIEALPGEPVEGTDPPAVYLGTKP